MESFDPCEARMRPKPSRLMDHREYPVLYVDDEPDNLRIFELTFRRDFTILTAGSAREGLELLSQHPGGGGALRSEDARHRRASSSCVRCASWILGPCGFW